MERNCNQCGKCMEKWDRLIRDIAVCYHPECARFGLLQMPQHIMKDLPKYNEDLSNNN